MALKKITSADLVNRGVIGLPDTPGMTTDEIQRKFDEIAVEVIVPAHNALVGELEEKGIGADTLVQNPVTGQVTSIQETLNDMKDEMDDNTEVRHAHDNKGVLDKITQIMLDNFASLWALLSGIKKVSKTIEDDDTAIPTSGAVNDVVVLLDNKISQNTEKRHEHDNKTVLDKITQAMLNKIALFNNINKVSETVEGGHSTIPTSGAVAAFVEELGGGDMTKATYDSNRDGIVDNASALGGIEAESYALKTDVNDGQITETTSPTLANSHAGGLKITPYGNTEQYGTTGKNLINSEAVTTTVSGVTFTVNSDGSITADGTATAGIAFRLTKSFYPTAGEKFTINGCPSGGGADKYRVYFAQCDEDGTSLGDTSDYDGSGATGTIVDGCSYLWIGIQIRNGVKVSNLTFYPMLRYASITDGTYEPYTGGQASPNPDYPCEIKSVKGKNLLDCRGLVEQTFNGVKFTPVKDEHGNLLYIEANGTATADATYTLNSAFMADKDYVLNGCASGGAESKYFLVCGGVGFDTGNGLKISADNVTHFIGATVKVGVTADHVRFYPMIRKATISDDTYVPYGLLRVKAHGKNLFAYGKNAKDCTAELRANSGQRLVLSAVEESHNKLRCRYAGGSYSVGYVVIEGIDGTKDYSINYEIESNTVEYTPTVKVNSTHSNSKQLVLQIEGNNKANNVSSSNYFILSNIQVEAGTETTAYEPYTENSITLSEPIELNGIGEVRDCIVEKDGVFGVERKFVKLPFTRGLIASVGYYEATNTNRFVIHLQKTPSKGSGCVIMCNIAKMATGGSDANTCRIYTAEQAFLFLDASKFPDRESFASYVESNEVYFIYELAEPTFEPLPTADQIALRSLMSYDGVTYVSCDCEVEPIIVTKYGTSEVGALSLHNSNLHGINEVLRAELDAKVTELSVKEDELQRQIENSLTAEDFTVSGDTLILNFL